MRPRRRGGLRNGEKRSRREDGGRGGPFIDVVCRTRYIGREANRASPIEVPRSFPWV